jgi:hypothetical protein
MGRLEMAISVVRPVVILGGDGHVGDEGAGQKADFSVYNSLVHMSANCICYDH